MLNPELSTLDSQPQPPPARAPKPITPRELAALHAQWAKIDAGRCDDRPSREARLDFISQAVGRPVSTTKDLTSDEALTVLQKMREETGEEFKAPGYGGRRRRRGKKQNLKTKCSPSVAAKIAAMAAELHGERWDDILSARIRDDRRLAVSRVAELSARQAYWLAEALLQQIAVRNLADRHQPPFPRSEIEAEKKILREKYFHHGETEAQ